MAHAPAMSQSRNELPRKIIWSVSRHWRPIFGTCRRFVHGRCHPLARHLEKLISDVRIGSQFCQPHAFARIADAFFIREHDHTRSTEATGGSTRLLTHLHRALAAVGIAWSECRLVPAQSLSQTRTPSRNPAGYPAPPPTRMATWRSTWRSERGLARAGPLGFGSQPSAGPAADGPAREPVAGGRVSLPAPSGSRMPNLLKLPQ
jgi:hypothetical protein